MLFGGDAGERLEPVREVGRAFLDSPFLHGMRHDIGNFDVERLAFGDGFEQAFIRRRRQALLHRVLVEHHRAVDIRNLRHGCALLIRRFQGVSSPRRTNHRCERHRTTIARRRGCSHRHRTVLKLTSKCFRFFSGRERAPRMSIAGGGSFQAPSRARRPSTSRCNSSLLWMPKLTPRPLISASRRGIDINLMRHHPSHLNVFAAISAFSAPLGAMACPNRMPIR